ncbi:MAG: hypothetical protein E5W26_03740 [Mesorhizobium sp.]|nr:MAG: hypothetical protein E5W26_03740 [Mesorhizobium sp.]
MSMIPYTLSRDALTVFLKGVPYSMNDSHPNYEAVHDMIGFPDVDEDELLKLVSYRETLKAVTVDYGDVSVGQDCVLYKGKVVTSYLTSRMLDILALGKDIGPWARFMDKLYANPSKTAVDELFLWLEKANMPITTNGNFLAYKKVQDDYTSYHANPDGSRVDNRVGATPSMPRNEVSDNRNQTCAAGLHFCSWHYLPHYNGSTGKVVILEIDPGDVVSIPSDYQNAKGRAWTYKVVGEIDQAQTEFAFKGTPIAA